MISPKPTDFANALGISVGHASNILNGKRLAGSEIALAAFRAFGVRLGLLAEMSDDDIAKLCDQNCHIDGNTTADAAPATGQKQTMSPAENAPT